MKLLNGDYVFSVEDSENLAIVRDPIGAKPLYFEILSEKTGLSSTYNQIAIGKSRKTLWKHGISNPKTLIPGNIIYNNKIIENSYFIENSYYPLKKVQKKHFDPNKIYKKEFYKNNLKKLLENSVKMRIKDLNKVGIIFSGGIDSTIIAKIIKDISKENKIEVKLYTVGTENSKDIEFSEKIAKDLDLPLKTQVITKEIIENNLKNLLITIEEADIVKIGVGMTIHLSTKLAKEDGRDVVLSGQGADELFGGYHRYLKTFEDKGEIAIANELKHDIENMYHVNLERDIPIAMSNGIEMRSPFLDPDFIDLALNIPIKYKIKSYDDNLRKHILREIGEDLAIPDYVVNRPKKAAQYGSGIHKILSKKILKEFDYKLFLKELKNSYLASE
jgi:asparagine synthase (glutamine-hydrolysing)